MDILIFGELISSNSFFDLLQRSFNLFVPYIGLGTYSQGIPVANIVDFFWGTNAGTRATPILIFLTFLQKFFANNWTIVFFALSLILPFFTFFFASRIIKKPTLWTIIGSIIYGGNVWIVDRLFTGFWQLNIVYAFLPFLVTILLKIATQKKNIQIDLFFWAALYAILASIILTAQPHFLIIIAIFYVFFLAKIILKKQFLAVTNLVKFLLLTFVLFLFLNAYFIFTGVFTPETLFTASNQYFSLAALRFNGQGSTLLNILRMNSSGFSSIKSSWGLIGFLQLFPIIMFTILFCINRKKNYLFLCLVILFIFFSKGLNPPFVAISNLLYQKLFFMHYFRDSSRFLAGVSLFLSLSIGLQETYSSYSYRTKNIIIGCIALLCILININSFKHTKTQIFRNTSIPSSYILMQKYINTFLTKQRNSRLLILPNMHGLSGYSWYQNISPSSSNTIFDAILPLDIQLADSTNYPDNYSNQMSAFVYDKFTQTYDSSYLNPLAINYILVDTSIQSPLAEKNIATESAKQLTALHYTLVHKENNLLLFKVPSSSSLFSTSRPIFAIGNLNTVIKLTKSSPNTPIILLNQSVNSTKNYSNTLHGESLFEDVENPSLVLTCERLSSSFNIDILNAGWDYDKLFSNYEPYKMTYIKNSGELYTSGRAVSSSLAGSMSVENQAKKGRYIILIKALTQNKTSLILTIDNKTTSIPLDTHKTLQWQNAGTIILTTDNKNIVLTKNTTDLIVIDQLLLVPIEKFNKEYSVTNQLLQNMNLHQQLQSEKNLYSFNKSNSYGDIYLNKSQKYFTYNASYGKYWITEKPSEEYVSNGYGMTFINNNNGIKRLYYLPNYLYRFTLFISGVTLTFLCIYVLGEICKKK